MDTSETYIRMCQTPEIQASWSPKEGDWIWGNTLPYKADGDKAFVFGDWIEQSDSYQSGWAAWDGPNDCSRCGQRGTDDDVDFLPACWLPRQDQLQEMVGDAMRVFRRWCYWWAECGDPFYGTEGTHPAREYWDQFTSFEQLWLAFVMKEKGKVWNGDEWV